MATQQDLQTMEGRISKRFENVDHRFEKLDQQLQEMETRLVHQFGVIAENLLHEFRGAALDKLDLHDGRLQDHDLRLHRIEDAVGFTS